MCKEKTSGEFNNAPLAVCINDCQLDFGQSPSDLAPICFRVHCAFAEMRWGSCEVENPETAGFILLQPLQITSAKSHKKECY